MTDFDYLFKVFLIGDSGSCKNAILSNCSDPPPSNPIPTIGINVQILSLSLPGQMIRLQIFDTKGQERFQNITKNFYKGANGLLIVFNKSSRSSFDFAKSMLSQIIKASRKSIPLILVGLKQNTEESINTDEAFSYSQSTGVEYTEIFETSRADTKFLLSLLSNKMISQII